MNACIRESNADDCKAVYALICSMEEKQLPPTEFEKIYNAQQKDDSCLCLVCEQEGKVVGCLNLRMEYQLHHAAKIAEIMELCRRTCKMPGNRPETVCICLPESQRIRLHTDRGLLQPATHTCA